MTKNHLKTTVLLLVFIFLGTFCIISLPESYTNSSSYVFVKLLDPRGVRNSSTTTIEFELQQCGCHRALDINLNSEKQYSNNKSSDNNHIYFENTTCSMDAFRRGPSQKIVGFSFYGDINSEKSKKKHYFEGIRDNLALMPKIYPGWVMRLYYDLDKNDPTLKDLCNLACHDANLDICDVKNLPGTPFKDAAGIFAMNWRFFPTLDPQVDAFVSRDLDSRINEREQAAVQEWLQSHKAFHVMRDHPAHGVSVVGSTWGTKLTDLGTRMLWMKTWRKGLTKKLLWAPRSKWGPDQDFLHRYVWPWAKENSIAHDSYSCARFSYTKAFPTKRKMEPNNFVASVVAENHVLNQSCPKICRPRDHLDWEYC